VKRWSLRVLLIAGLLALLLGGAYAWALWALRGEHLGRAVTDGAWPVPALNPTIQGRLKIARIDWGLAAPLDLLLGRAHEARASGVEVYDPRGRLCLRIPRIRARIDLRALLFSGDFLIASARAPRAVVLLEDVLATGADASTPEVPVLNLLWAFSARRPSTQRGPRVELGELFVDHLEFDLQKAAWRLRLPDAAVSGSLRHAGGDVAQEGMPFRLAAPSPFAAKLRVLGLDFELRDARLDRFQVSPLSPGDLSVALSMTTAEGAKLSADGEMTSIFQATPGIRMRLGLTHAGPMLSRLSGLPISGDVSVGSTIHGDLADPTIDLEAEGASLPLGPVVLQDVRLAVRMRGPRIEARQLQARLLGGQLTAKGGFHLETLAYDAEVDLSGADLRALVPALAGRFDARAKISGQADQPRLRADLDATFSPARRGRLPRRVRVTGSAEIDGSRLYTDGLVVSAPGASARVRGTARLDRRDLDMSIDLSSRSPGSLMPELHGAKDLRVAAKVSGTFDRPDASGTVRLNSLQLGSLSLHEIASPFRATSKDVTLSDLRAKASGGTVRASATLRDPLRAPVLEAKGEFEGLDLSAAGVGLRGRLAGGVRLEGRLDALSGRASCRSERVEAAGYVLEDVEATARLAAGVVHLDELAARAGGARIRVSGRLDPDGTLSAAGDFSGFRLDRKEPVPMSGTVTGHLALGGTIEQPRLSGKIDLEGFRVRQMDLGDGQLEMAPDDHGGSKIAGALFAGRLKVDASLRLLPLALKGGVKIKGFDLTGLLPEMRELGFVSAPATGRIHVQWDQAHGLRAADFRLESFRVTHRDENRREIRVENRRPVRVHYRDGRAVIEPAELVSTRIDPAEGDVRRARARRIATEDSAGYFGIEGWIEAEDSDVQLRGAVSLELVQFFWHRLFLQTHGEARADLRLRGPPGRPNAVGSLELFGAVLVPRDLDRAIYVPEGRVEFSADKIVLRRLVLQAGQADLRIDGALTLRELRPDTLDLEAQGTLAAELLQMGLRDHVSSASGSFHVALRAQGPWKRPVLEGEIRPERVEIVPRRLGRTVTLLGGRLRFERDRLLVDGLRGLVDEGQLQVDGEIDFSEMRFAAVDLRLHGENLPHRVPGQYEAELNLDVRLRGDAQALALRGQVDVVDARYTRDFQVTRLVLRPKVVEEAEPVWRGIPLLQEMALALRVTSTGSVGIRNNVADIALGVSLDVTGTPDAARLDGEVRAEEGSFHLPLLKGTYTVDGGGVAFLESQPTEQARVLVEGTSLVMDRSGTEHDVHLRLVGTLQEMQLSLTSPGLDPGQVLSLVATGRTTEQLRADLRGDENGSGGGGTASPGAAAADQSIKELTSDLFNVVVDPFSRAFRADTSSFEVGSESIDIQLCWKLLGQRTEACGEGEQFLAGGQHVEGRVEVRIDEVWSAQFKAEHRELGQDTMQPDVTRLRLQFGPRLRLR